MNIAQYLQLPLSYCNYVQSTNLIRFDSELLVKYLQRKTTNPPHFIINYLIDKASRHSRLEKMYHIYTIAIFHLLAKPVFQRELLKHTNFLTAVLNQLDILIKTTVDTELKKYIKQTFVVNKVILRKKLKQRLYYLLYVRSVFVNLYFSTLQKRYAFGNTGYFQSKNNYENLILTLNK